MEQGVRDIDAMVREEKRLTAVESHNEAWAEGLSAGIEADIIADIQERKARVALLDRVREMVVAGDFEPSKRLH